MRVHFILRPAFCLLAFPVWGFAGDAVVPRKQFKQSATYPFVFRSECYLATNGPAPLRFSPAPPACASRHAPPLPVSAKANSVPAKDASTVITAAEEISVSTGPAPAYPPPANAPQRPTDEVDLNRVPDEVLDFFKSTEGRPVARNYLFDPIFQPAIPQELPRSKATYREK